MISDSAALLPKFNTGKSAKISSVRAASVFFYGLIFGFLFSFLFIYTNVVQDESAALSQVDSQTENVVKTFETENLAEYLFNTQRVLCIVITNTKEIEDNVDYIMNTWGKRCNKIIFFSQSDPKTNSTANIIVSPESDNFARMRKIFKFIYASEMHNFDWLLNVADSTFIVMENLRHLLYQYNSKWPLLIGQRFLNEDYMIGTFVLSKGAFVRLVENAFTNPQFCSQTGSFPDKDLAKCCQNVNILKIDGIDDEGKGMFFHEKPELSLFPVRLDLNFDKYYWHKLKQGMDNCCSDRLIALRNFRDIYLYYLEYYIYKVKIFGRHRNREELPQKKTLEEIVQKFK